MSSWTELRVLTFLEGERYWNEPVRLLGSHEFCNVAWKALTGSDPPWHKANYSWKNRPKKWRLSYRGGFIDFYGFSGSSESVKGDLSLDLAKSVQLKLQESGVPCIFVSWQQQEAENEAAREVVEENIRQMLDEPAWSSFEGSDADFWARVRERYEDEAEMEERRIRDLELEIQEGRINDLSEGY